MCHSWWNNKTKKKKYNESKLKRSPGCRRICSGFLPLRISGVSVNVDTFPWKLLEMFSYASVGLSTCVYVNPTLLLQHSFLLTFSGWHQTATAIRTFWKTQRLLWANK